MRVRFESGSNFGNDVGCDGFAADLGEVLIDGLQVGFAEGLRAGTMTFRRLGAVGYNGEGISQSNAEIFL